MRTESEMVAYALEVDPDLLPYIPELLADFESLGSQPGHVIEVLQPLELSPGSRVMDLGCGKGAVALAIARAFGCRVDGIDLFAPFVAHCQDQADAAGVAHLCTFHHGDIQALAGSFPPADVATYLALGDTLGPLADTMGVIRQYVRPGGCLLIGEDYSEEGASTDLPGYADMGTYAQTAQQLQLHGDSIIHVATEHADLHAAYAQELAHIRRRASELEARRPALAAKLAAFVTSQEQAYNHMEEHLNSAMWLLRRSA